ncbi:MAG: AI-2E family transporter [Bacteroidetes bacterium]|nr:AI-2E family transporter [Bacteroidota bacterium]
MQRFFVYLILSLVTFLVFGSYFSAISLYLVTSLILAALLRPLTNKINEVHILGQHIPRGIAILASYATMVSTVFLLGLLFFPLINRQVIVLSDLDLESIYLQLEVPLEKLERFLLKYQLIDNKQGILIEELRFSIQEPLKKFNIGGFITGAISITSNIFIGTLAVAFICFFLLFENGLLRRNLLNLIPNAYFELSVATFTKVEKLLSNYLFGLLLQVLAIFLLAAFGLSLSGVEYALTIALFAAIANLIPYAGPILGIIFGILVGITTEDFTIDSDYSFFLFKIISVFAAVQITDNVLLQPLIFSKSVKAHPLEIFVIIFAGAKIAGILGMIFAIPVYTIFRVSVLEFYSGYKSYKIFKIKVTN